MGVTFTGRADLELKTLATFETEIRNGKLMDVVAGDLNADGVTDLMLLEEARNNIEIVARMPDGKLKRAVAWNIFEQKTFRGFGPGGGGPEPREAVIGDINNDGRNDIAILVHNRVIVYLQDPGTAPATPGKAPADKAKPATRATN
jgi:hypothetical protein